MDATGFSPVNHALLTLHHSVMKLLFTGILTYERRGSLVHSRKITNVLTITGSPSLIASRMFMLALT